MGVINLDILSIRRLERTNPPIPTKEKQQAKDVDRGQSKTYQMKGKCEDRLCAYHGDCFFFQETFFDVFETDTVPQQMTIFVCTMTSIQEVQFGLRYITFVAKGFQTSPFEFRKHIW